MLMESTTLSCKAVRSFASAVAIAEICSRVWVCGFSRVVWSRALMQPDPESRLSEGCESSPLTSQTARVLLSATRHPPNEPTCNQTEQHSPLLHALTLHVR